MFCGKPLPVLFPMTLVLWRFILLHLWGLLMVMHFSSPLSCSRYFFLSFSLVFLSSSSSFFFWNFFLLLVTRNCTGNFFHPWPNSLSLESSLKAFKFLSVWLLLNLNCLIVLLEFIGSFFVNDVPETRAGGGLKNTNTGTQRKVLWSCLWPGNKLRTEAALFLMMYDVSETQEKKGRGWGETCTHTHTPAQKIKINK